MDVKVDIKNYNEVSRHFKERAKNLTNTVQRVVNKVALLVERQAKFYSPVKTGRMRASILPVELNQRSAYVRPNVEYAPFVHRRVPFMTAARQDVEPQVEGLVEKEVRQALK